MFTLQKAFPFEAAHRLPHHDGKCARLHGHSWLLTVEVQGAHLYDAGPKQGMLLDYYDISQAVKPLVEDHLDHWYLNESTGLENPTSEELAKWVYHRLCMTPLEASLSAVIINETCTSRCEFRPWRKT